MVSPSAPNIAGASRTPSSASSASGRASSSSTCTSSRRLRTGGSNHGVGDLGERGTGVAQAVERADERLLHRGDGGEVDAPVGRAEVLHVGLVGGGDGHRGELIDLLDDVLEGSDVLAQARHHPGGHRPGRPERAVAVGEDHPGAPEALDGGFGVAFAGLLEAAVEEVGAPLDGVAGGDDRERPGGGGDPEDGRGDHGDPTEPSPVAAAPGRGRTTMPWRRCATRGG